MIKYPTILTIRNIPTAVIDRIFYRGWKKWNKGSRAKHINRDARFLDFWILLKALNKAGTASGTIRDYMKQLPELLRICKIERSTFFTRKKWLIAKGLMREAGGHLFLKSYKYLEPLYGIDTSERYKETVYYDTIPTNKQRLAEMLYLEGEKLQTDRCRHEYNKKMNAQPDVRQAIKKRAIEYGANPEKIEKDSEYFRQSHDKLQVMSYKKAGMEDIFYLTHTFCNANPDLNMSHARIGRHNGFAIQAKVVKPKKEPVSSTNNEVQDDGKKKKKEKIRYSCSGRANLEKRLAKKGLIVAKEQRVVVSEWRARIDESVFNVSWIEERHGEKVRETIWFKPRGIKIINRQNFETKKTA